MIEIGSKWVHIKTGNRYEVVQIMDCAIHEENLHYDGNEVWYKTQKTDKNIANCKEAGHGTKMCKNKLGQ